MQANLAWVNKKKFIAYHIFMGIIFLNSLLEVGHASLINYMDFNSFISYFILLLL